MEPQGEIKKKVDLLVGGGWFWIMHEGLWIYNMLMHLKSVFWARARSWLYVKHPAIALLFVSYCLLLKLLKFSRKVNLIFHTSRRCGGSTVGTNELGSSVLVPSPPKHEVRAVLTRAQPFQNSQCQNSLHWWLLEIWDVTSPSQWVTAPAADITARSDKFLKVWVMYWDSSTLISTEVFTVYE